MPVDDKNVTLKIFCLEGCTGRKLENHKIKVLRKQKYIDEVWTQYSAPVIRFPEVDKVDDKEEYYVPSKIF